MWNMEILVKGEVIFSYTFGRRKSVFGGRRRR